MNVFKSGVRWMLVLALAAGCSKPPHTPLASSESIVITPKTAFGPLRSGMSVQQVIDEIGKPGRRDEFSLQYERLGFYIATRNGQVQSVVCVRPPARKPGNAKAFAGRTSRGVRLAAGRAEVIRAYGNPERIDKLPNAPGDEVLRYTKLGLVFFMHDGVVDSIAMIF